MAREDEEHLTENNPEINTVTNETPRKFGFTLEFTIFLFMLAISLSSAAINNILLYRTCVHSLNYTESVCKVFLAPDKSNTSQQLEKEVQKYVTFVSTVRSIIESLVPAFLSFFLGVWSNTHGRKPLIVWPLLGMTFTGILVVVYTMMDSLGPWWFIITVLPLSLTGSFTVLLTGAFCYISDMSTEQARSIRMTLLEGSISAGSFVGLLVSSPLLKAVGNVYLLLIVAAIFAIAYCFSNICLSESLEGARQGGLYSVFDFSLVKEMFRECFKSRPNYGRAQILLLTVANSLTVFVMYGVLSLEYYYTREKLQWTLKNFNTFSAVNTVLSFFGAFFGVIVLQKLLHISDLTLALVAFFSGATEYVFKAIAINSWYMYVGASVSLLKGLASPLIRSLLSKILPVEDIAKIFALMSAIEGVSPIIANTLYNSLYEYTIEVFPGAIYVLSTAILGSCGVMLITVQYFRWKTSSPSQSVVE